MRFTTLGLLVAMAFGSAAYAESHMAEEMNAGLTMLQVASDTVLRKYGFDSNAMDLTLAQLAEIQGLLQASNSEGDIKSGIQAVLAK